MFLDVREAMQWSRVLIVLSDRHRTHRVLVYVNGIFSNTDLWVELRMASWICEALVKASLYMWSDFGYFGSFPDDFKVERGL